MSFLQDIISSTAAGLKKEEKLVKGKKWVKRGVVKKISEKKEYEERVRKKQEAERAKRRRRELEASQQLAKKTRLQLQRTEKKIGLSNNNDGTTPATAQSAATTAEVVGEEEDAADGGSKLILPVAEVVRRLRSMGAPITLFGETDLERLKRMRKVEVEGLDDEGILHTGTHAMRNVFLKGKQHREGTDEVDDLAEFDTEGGTTTDETQLGMLGDAGVSMTGEEARVSRTIGLIVTFFSLYPTPPPDTAVGCTRFTGTRKETEKETQTRRQSINRDLRASFLPPHAEGMG